MGLMEGGDDQSEVSAMTTCKAGSLLIGLSDRDVALETLVFCPADRTVAEPCGKGRFVEGSQVVQAGGYGRWGWEKGRFLRRVSSEIEGADVQTIVTSEDVITHPRSEFIRNVLARTTKFDRQI